MKFLEAKNQAEIFAVINIRKDVFIIEQNVDISEELDDKDYLAKHYLIKYNDEYIATGRVYFEDDFAVVGRFAVLKPYRKHGVGKFLLSNIIESLKSENVKKFKLGAQVSAYKFYEKFGFKVSGPVFLDANIKHYPMELLL